MTVQVLTGSKNEIADAIARLTGDVREAIVFVYEPQDSVPQPPTDDIFAEMEPFTVRAGGADYSRESIYARLDDG